MAPPLQKVWQGGSTSGGTQFVSAVVGGTAPRDTLFAIKDAMVNFFSNPWTVVGSSDSGATGMDAVDRWVSSGDIVYPTNALDPFSWIVLEQTAIGATYQVMLYTNEILATDPNRQNVGIVSNAGGFGVANGGTDGSTTALPTPSDTSRSTSVDGDDWLGAEATSTQMVLTCISSTDGECTRIVASMQSSGVPILGLGFEVPRLPQFAWTTPAVLYLYKSTVASGLSCFRWETMTDSVALGEMQANVDTLDATAFRSIRIVPTMPAFSTLEVIDEQEDVRPNPLLFPPTLFGLNTDAGSRDTARNHGTLFDWYWCNRNPAGVHLSDLDTVPAAGDRTFVCVGDCVWGWLDDSATDLSYT